MIFVENENFDSEVTLHNGLVVIDLYADWCVPCRMLAPVMEELENKYKDVKFVKINIDESRELAKMFHVDNIPMVAFVKDDTFLDFSVGLVPIETLEKMINEYK